MAKAKASEEMANNVASSISTIYAGLMQKEKIKRAEKHASKSSEETIVEEKIKDPDDYPTKKTKKQKAEEEIAKWSKVFQGIGGEGFDDVVTGKREKRKYKKWALTDAELIEGEMKKKKAKKIDYAKRFEPDINMLSRLLADQNRFTTDLLKRYQLAAGPANKDAGPINKTLVELASVINNSRTNSLGFLREIASNKKSIADLTMKQRKLDSDLGGGSQNLDSENVALMGSSVADEIFGASIVRTPVSGESSMDALSSQTNSFSDIPPFDPSSWNSDGYGSKTTVYESIPHEVVVAYSQDKGVGHFKAIKPDGSELVGAPLPTCKIKVFDTASLKAKDEFEASYRMILI